jgi:hypothetical protein
MMPMPKLAPAPQEWSLAVHFSPVKAFSRIAEAQVEMTLAAAGLLIALSPLGLAGAMGRRAPAPTPAPRSGGATVVQLKPALAAVPAPTAPRPVPP